MLLQFRERYLLKSPRGLLSEKRAGDLEINRRTVWLFAFKKYLFKNIFLGISSYPKLVSNCKHGFPEKQSNILLKRFSDYLYIKKYFQKLRLKYRSTPPRCVAIEDFREIWQAYGQDSELEMATIYLG